MEPTQPAPTERFLDAQTGADRLFGILLRLVLTVTERCGVVLMRSGRRPLCRPEDDPRSLAGRPCGHAVGTAGTWSMSVAAMSYRRRSRSPGRRAVRRRRRTAGRAGPDPDE
jgi:hypothetical protein